ncbi:DUF2147 domain-containing protein [Oscillatoria amoena NRMC-F 0135]|nr:DUF2147 domain-containing protein [Oscillatoria amoena NRMC-F 0135]
MIRVLLLLLVALEVSAQTVLGKWKTIDDVSGEVKSVVELSERNGKVFGKVIQTFPKPGDDPDPACTKCDSGDDRYRKKIIGMEILRDLIKSGNEYKEGSILDPENGKVYRCKIWLEGQNLKLRGYWGPFWRTQTWVPAD